MNSISVLHSNILKKIDLLISIANCKPKTTKTIMLQISNFRASYLLLTLPIINSYYEKDEITRQNMNEEFEELIIAENIVNRIEDYGNILMTFDLPYTASPFIHDFKQLSLISKNVFKCRAICVNCSIDMVIRPELSDYCCSSCGYIERIDGINTDDNNDTQPKVSPYKPSKHCEEWVLCIFACEKTDIPDDLINSIRSCMNRDGVTKSNLSCKLIRNTYLKELHRTEYNSNTPKIRKILTGISPPRPTPIEFEMICKKFDLSDSIYMHIKPPNYTSRRHYPYFIRKIIEDVYSDKPRVRNAIIEGIHMQERKTKESHDILWERICQASNGRLKFTKTKEITYYQ